MAKGQSVCDHRTVRVNGGGGSPPEDHGQPDGAQSGKRESLGDQRTVHHRRLRHAPPEDQRPRGTVDNAGDLGIVGQRTEE